ncbi:MAG: hypothetical protein ABL966_16840 [Acidimicrobiales bacterium]
MTVRGVTLCIVLAAGAAACSDTDDPQSATTTAAPASTTTTTAPPERAPSTTTTAFDPTSIEGEIEAAYLRSWDVYATAVYDLELDEAALAAVYAGDLLVVRRDEIARRISDERAALVLVDHDYTIELTGTDTAIVIDTYVNHQVLIDSHTKAPIEPDPDEIIVDAFTLRRSEAGWIAFDLERLS